MRRTRMRTLLQLLLLLLVLICSVKAQISKPVAHDKNFQESVENNKFLSRQATDDLLGYPNLDEEALANSQCPRHVELRWQTEVSSSIYATPLIADINADGKLDIVVPSFVHYLDILEGADGEKIPGWPVFHQSIVHSSPLLYDIDKDGLREILLPTYNGEILIFRSSGYLLSDKMTVPRLRVRKDWHVGLSPDHVDRSQPDIHDESLVPHPPMNSGNDTGRGTEGKNQSASISSNIPGNSSAVVNQRVRSDNTSIEVPQNVKNTFEKSGGSDNTTKENNRANAKVDDVASAEGISGTTSLEMAVASSNQTHDARMQGALRRLFQESVEKTVEHATNSEENKVTVENNQELLDQDAEASFDVFRDQGENDLTDEYNYDYDDYVDDSMWGDEEWHEAQHEKEEDYINIDAHILCTPVIADIDKDGVDEMVVAASFFFDREYYETPEHAAEIGNIDIGKYVAGAIVVFNLETKQVKWKTHLDLSTDSVSFRAYIYSSPTVVDLDGNGNLSIIVGTSFGFVYALHNNGSVRANFPLQMGEIQAQVIAADVNDDGKVEIVTADTRGNVAAWTPHGKEVWEVHLKSLIAQAPTVGDVNGDGNTDVVVPTVSGNIYVLKGTDGSFVPPFPFRTHGRIMSSVLLVDLSSRDAEQTGLTLVTTSFDGYMYLVDGKSGCADAIDIGETTYSMVLAENVDGGDDLDLIVSTMNGNVYCFQTPAPHHPSKSWPMQAHGRNVMSVRHNREGVFALPSSRTYRDEAGDSFWVVFKIVDQHGLQGPYNVTVTLLVPGNYQGPRRIAQWKLYDQPGVQKMKLPCVSVRTTGTVSIEMVDKHGFYFWDEFALAFHMHYYRLLKWMIMLPMLGMLTALVLLNPRDQIALPSFSSDRHQS